MTRHRQHRQAFTLLETLLALMVFSIAIVALVEAINQLGGHTLQRRHSAAVQERVRSILIEQTRSQDPKPPEDLQIKEGTITYDVKRTPLELFDRDGNAVVGIFEVRVTATWQEARAREQVSAETWVYPPLFRQQ